MGSPHGTSPGGRLHWRALLGGGLRVVAVLGVVALVVVLARILVGQGYTPLRLGLFGLIGLAAIVGGVGVVSRSVVASLAGALGLFLLGFWQAVLFVFVLPVSAVLVLVAVVDAGDDETAR